ncbi:MAG: type I methionyl aminopeptidase [Candidatus Omnitrophota bacterium]|jgi:methionyl aminopeptidase
MIPLKSEKDLQLIRQSGQILSQVMRQLEKFVREGVLTREIDELAEKLIREQNALPAFKGYKGFPATVCTSINEEIVHGIPSERRLKNGDILGLDVGVKYNGYFSDAAVTLPVGVVPAKVKKLIEVARKALAEGIKEAKPGNHLLDISAAIQRQVEKNGFSVVRQFVGHGIGTSLHEDPEIPNFGQPHHGLLLEKGMVLAIEPMVNMGGWEAEISANGWTAVTKDGLPSAHFEHTVAITEKGPEILTR